MTFLILLFIIVFILKYFYFIRESFDGNCIKKLDVNFSNSKLKYKNVMDEFNKKSDDFFPDISGFINNSKSIDFPKDEPNINNFLKDPLSDNYKFIDQKKCSLDYMF